MTFKDTGETKENAEELKEQLASLREAYKDIRDKNVEPAFSKFDKDGNGTIDKDELSRLSEDLGQPLDQTQIDLAMRDLDMNNDGVIDLDEFARWYFTGMKSYNGTTRSML